MLLVAFLKYSHTVAPPDVHPLVDDSNPRK